MGNLSLFHLLAPTRKIASSIISIILRAFKCAINGRIAKLYNTNKKDGIVLTLNGFSTAGMQSFSHKFSIWNNSGITEFIGSLLRNKIIIANSSGVMPSIKKNKNRSRAHKRNTWLVGLKPVGLQFVATGFFFIPIQPKNVFLL